MARDPLSVREGLIAGAVAGLVMSGWKMGGDGVRGEGLWGAPKLIATILPGSQPYDGSHQFRLWPVAIGMALHEATSAVMGAIYVPLVRHPILRHRPVTTAVVHALVSWVTYQYGIMPWLAPIMDRHSSPRRLAAAHIVFGLALGSLTILATNRRPASK